jgi:hypothetical protein
MDERGVIVGAMGKVKPKDNALVSKLICRNAPDMKSLAVDVAHIPRHKLHTDTERLAGIKQRNLLRHRGKRAQV